MPSENRTVKTVAALLGALLLVAAGSGCQYPIEAGSTWAPGDISPPGPTYAWVSGKSAPTGNPLLDNPEARELIRKTVEDQLAAKGYTSTSPDAADFWLTDRVGKEILGDPNTLGFEQYTEGSLMLYLVNPKTNQVRWRGWASARLNEANPPEVRKKRLEEAVSKMFKDFPSRVERKPGARP